MFRDASRTRAVTSEKSTGTSMVFIGLVPPEYHFSAKIWFVVTFGGPDLALRGACRRRMNRSVSALSHADHAPNVSPPGCCAAVALTPALAKEPSKTSA